jgi:ssDNA-binding Zn-finger/Zn-ribbon topoisomerase 1
MCFQCSDFPCAKIAAFPVESAKDAMLEAAQQCKQHGHEKYLQSLREKYTCNNCGSILFRGATRCPKCRFKTKPQKSSF